MSSSMADDVLAPFVHEWAERARALQAAADAIAAAQQTCPRIERAQLANGTDVHVLVRAEGGLYGHAVTVRFTPDEWALLEAAILARHGLTSLD